MNHSTPTSPKKPDPLKILLMGGAGTRKTTLALQFPKPHVYDCDRNLDGPVRFLREGLKDEKGKVLSPALCPLLDFTWDSIRYDDSGTAIGVEECFNRLCDKLKFAAIDPEYQTRETHILDSLSHVNEFIIRSVLKAQGKTKNIGDMEMRDWNPFGSRAYEMIVGHFERLKKTLICICHETAIAEIDPRNPGSKTIKGYEPFFQGKVGDNLGAFFTDVWRMELRQSPSGNETWLITQKTPKCDVLKNSVGMPAEVNVSGGWKAVEQYLKGKV